MRSFLEFLVCPEEAGEVMKDGCGARVTSLECCVARWVVFGRGGAAGEQIILQGAWTLQLRIFIASSLPVHCQLTWRCSYLALQDEAQLKRCGESAKPNALVQQHVRLMQPRSRGAGYWWQLTQPYSPSSFNIFTPTKPCAISAFLAKEAYFVTTSSCCLFRLKSLMVSLRQDGFGFRGRLVWVELASDNRELAAS